MSDQQPPYPPRHPYHPRRPATVHHRPVTGHTRQAALAHRPRAAETPDPDAAAPGSPAPAAPGGTTARRSSAVVRQVPLPARLGTLTVLLGAFAIVAAAQVSALRGAPAAQNTALTDSVTTRQITSQVSGTVETIFSYSYTDIARTRLAAHRVLTGAAIRQYASAIRTVAAAAIPDKLVVTTAVTFAGVEYQHGDRAHVLLFVNLSDTSGVTGHTTSQPGMLAVDVVLRGRTWKITNIRTFTGGG